MKHGWLRRALILLTALGLCFAMYRRDGDTPQETPERLRLWYAEGDCSPAAMDKLLTRCRKELGIQIEARSFADEAALGAAFTDDRPDLLFCSHIRAAQLDGRGSLAALSESFSAPEPLSQLRPAVGKSFFPIGSRLPVLLVNTALTDKNLDSFDALLTAAGEEAFIGCDSWAALLYTQASAVGIPVCGLPERDMEDTDFAALYNRVALAVFRGGLVMTEGHAADYVRQGELACAVVSSTVLAQLAEPTDKALEVRLLPLPTGTEPRYTAELMGFALLDGADTELGARFADWLWTGRGTETALNAGLVPIERAYTGAGANSAAGRLLLPLAENDMLFWPDADEPFVQNRDSGEQSLREILDLLA